MSVQESTDSEDSPLVVEGRHWEYAGKGSIVKDDTPLPDTTFTQHWIASQEERLGQFTATAISGNDITSSCLYVAGAAAVSAGKFAPISLLLVVLVLWMFKGMTKLFMNQNKLKEYIHL